MGGRLVALSLSLLVVASLGAGAAGVSATNDATTDVSERGVHASSVDGAELDRQVERFTAVGTDGYALIGDGSGDEIAFPACPDGEGEECVEFSGDVDPETGTYTVPRSQFHFPDLTVPDTSIGDVDATVGAPDGLEGEIDPDTGAMTLSGTLEITAQTPLGDCDIAVPLEGTTGDSGSMSGAAFDSGAGTTGATLVDNAYEVPAAEGGGVCGQVDDELGLPSEAGESEFELETALDLEYAEDVDRIEGEVFDESTRYADGTYSGVADATVAVAGTDYETTTDGTGAFSLSASGGELGAPGDQVTLEVSHERYRDDTVTATLGADGVATVDAVLEPDWGGAEVAVLPQPLKGETGETLTMPFEVESLDRSTDRQVDEFTIAFEYDPAVVVLDGVAEADWEGLEVDHDPGSVTVSGADDSATTDFTAFAAEFELIGDAGEHTEITFDGGASELIEAGFLGFDSEYETAFSHTPVAVDGPYYGALEGTVTDDADEPVEGATVDVGGEELTTDADGAYALEDLEPGEYDVDVGHDEYEDRTVAATVRAEETATVDVTLGTPTGVVEGVVTDADGEPVEGATVAAGDQQTTTDADGAYDLELDVGDYDLEASADDFESDSATVTVEDSTTTTQDLALEAQEDSNGDGPADVAPDEFDAEGWADWLEGDALETLEAEYYAQVPGEINAQSQEQIGEDIVDPVGSPEDMRAEADAIESTLGNVDGISEAVDALRSAADAIEEHRDRLFTAAADLRSADDPESEAERINEDVIAAINADVAESNERLENVDDMQGLEEIDVEGEPEESSDPPADENDADDGDDDDSDAMGAALQNFGVVVAVASILVGAVSTVGASGAPVLAAGRVE